MRILKLKKPLTHFCDLEPDVGEPSDVPNVGEHNEVPNVGEPNEVPNVADQTEIPNDAEHSDGSEGSNDSDDNDFDMDLEDRIEEDMADFRKYIDENVEWVGPNEVPIEDTQPVEAKVFEDLDLEDFDSASDPDDIDSNRKKALKMLDRKHKPVDGNIYSENFYYGQTFSNKELIKGMGSRLAVENRRQLWLSKNDKVRVRAQCRGVVPTFSNDDGSHFGPNGPSGSTGPSVMSMAHDNVIRDFVNQYARLKDYALELQEQNPDTTIKIDVERTCDPTSDTRKFRRIYILTAVGVDPNNGTYPLAYAVVEAETKDSWTWFLDCLGDDLQLVRNSNFTFITDRQKHPIVTFSLRPNFGGVKMLTCNPCHTLVDTDSKLFADGDHVSDPTLYRSLARALQYLTFTRPDISYAVQQVCLYMHDPRDPHFSALNRILRLGWVPHYTSDCVFLGNNLLSWSSKRQVTLFRSSTEAEYRGVANAVAETCWLHNLLRELHTPLSTATLVYCDNVSAVYLSSNSVQHQRTKHIEIDIHFVRDLVAAGVPSRYQYADVFTKGLPTVLFDEFRSSLSVHSSPAQTARGC
ncbi:ribonuclease H-like domain-containing protein [Tanacetum coccineum]